MSLVNRTCRICMAPPADILCSISLLPIEGEELPPNFDVVICENCGFCYDDIAATQEDFNKYYEKCVKYQAQGTQGSGGLTPKDIERYSAVFECCKKYLHPHSAILDIGAGKGGLLQYLKQHGFTDLTAVEPSAPKLESDGVTFYTSFDKLKSIGKQYDFIFCTHVLEHVFDLHVFVRNMQSLAAENAFFYVEVPNAHKYIEGIKAPFYYFDREHINHFTQQTLAHLFERNACTQVFCDDSKNLASIFKIAKTIVTPQECVDSGENIRKYVEMSYKRDDLSHLHAATPPIVLWGLGAYLRRIIVKEDFPKNIEAIIDRDRGGKGDFWNGIPLVTAEVLTKAEFSNATVIITSALYAEEIKNQLATMKFAGKVLMAF